MKSFSFLFVFFLVTACGGPKSEKEGSTPADSSKNMEEFSETERTEQYVKDYIAAVNSGNWKQEVIPFLKPDSDAFLEEHDAFRTSFPNFKIDIKHLVVDGNDVILWLEISANYVFDYTYDKSNYGDKVIRGIKARNQPVLWNETWYFDVVDGKFGDKWDFLKDHHTILTQLKADSGS